jgi:hypothetical protein
MVRSSEPSGCCAPSKSRRSLSPDSSVRMRVPIVTIALAEAFPVAIVVAVQSIHYEGVCPDPAHLFIDVLAKVGNVKNSTPIVQVCVHQIFSEAFEQG